MARRIVAIHQPNFFPWLGYFDKLARCDVFVVMDLVQFPKSGAGGWSNRVQLLSNGRARWVTMPVVRSYHGTRSIRETEISESEPWRERLLTFVEHEYAKAACVDEGLSLLRPLILDPSSSLCDYNTNAIRAVAAALGLPVARLVPMSALAHSGRATDLLISLVRAAGGDTYLCGAGSAGYLEPEKFAAAGIELVFQDFQHPEYRQVRAPTFVPGLSIVDALLNCGTAGTRALVGRHAR